MYVNLQTDNTYKHADIQYVYKHIERVDLVSISGPIAKQTKIYLHAFGTKAAH